MYQSLSASDWNKVRRISAQFRRLSTSVGEAAGDAVPAAPVAAGESVVVSGGVAVR
jgi:hypothetical protein